MKKKDLPPPPPTAGFHIVPVQLQKLELQLPVAVGHHRVNLLWGTDGRGWSKVVNGQVQRV